MKAFTFIVSFTALLVAGCAAFFSVKGIATLFSGAFIAALIMGASIEIGKIVATSALYRYWSKFSFLLRTYLTVAVIGLMFITSLGIYGFLASAYKDSALQYEVQVAKIENIESQKDVVVKQIEAFDVRIQTLNESRNSQEERLNEITSMIGKTMTARSAAQLQQDTQQLISDTAEDIKETQTKKDALFDKKMGYEEQILDLKLNNNDSKDIQTFKFIANEFNTDLDTVAKWFILLIIFVFDPLAVALVLAYNTIIMKEKDDIKPLPDTDEDPADDKPIKIDEPVKTGVVDIEVEDSSDDVVIKKSELDEIKNSVLEKADDNQTEFVFEDDFKLEGEELKSDTEVKKK